VCRDKERKGRNFRIGQTQYTRTELEIVGQGKCVGTKVHGGAYMYRQKFTKTKVQGGAGQMCRDKCKKRDKCVGRKV